LTFLLTRKLTVPPVAPIGVTVAVFVILVPRLTVFEPGLSAILETTPMASVSLVAALSEPDPAKTDWYVALNLGAYMNDAVPPVPVAAVPIVTQAESPDCRRWKVMVCPEAPVPASVAVNVTGPPVVTEQRFAVIDRKDAV
jgi:hypothetical protein